MKKTKKPLKAYLAGRMGNNKNDAKWRIEMTQFLSSLNIEALNPYLLEANQLKRLHIKDLPKGISSWHEFRFSEKPLERARFTKYMRHIIRFDTYIVKFVSDFVIVLWHEGCKNGAGTHGELTVALLSDKPVYCVEKHELPSWAYACCNKVFKNFSELHTFLKEKYENA